MSTTDTPTRVGYPDRPQDHTWPSREHRPWGDGDGPNEED